MDNYNYLLGLELGEARMRDIRNNVQADRMRRLPGAAALRTGLNRVLAASSWAMEALVAAGKRVVERARSWFAGSQGPAPSVPRSAVDGRAWATTEPAHPTPSALGGYPRRGARREVRTAVNAQALSPESVVQSEARPGHEGPGAWPAAGRATSLSEDETRGADSC